MLDIVLYAAIAAFLAYRLWSVLGQKEEGGGEDSSRPDPFAPQQDRTRDDENVMVLEGRPRPLLTSALTSGGNAPTSLAGTLDQIKQADPSFNEKKFMEGARFAFEGIVTCFAKGDLSPVARFMGPAVLHPFETAIEQRKSRNETLENKIERIVASDIIGAQLDGSQATLTVEFISHQVNITRNSAGEIVDGTPGKAEEVRDIWLFQRDVSSANPNWQLVETRS